MATNLNAGGPLTGDQLQDASQPIGNVSGLNAGITGVHSMAAPSVPQSAPQQPQLGPLLEEDDATVFKTVHDLVLRQEQLAKNRLAQDSYWTHVKLGRGGMYKLEKAADQDIWKCVPAPGIGMFPANSVPNKGWDLCNKTVETLMQDPPQPSPQAENDSEEAERGAEMAEEFLTQDGGEKGTRDSILFWHSLDAATSKSAAYHHYWVDKTGGGYVPLQIKAHPSAVSPSQPMIGADGSTTTDPILRYITNSDVAQAQFTDDPSQAPPQWLPKICVDRWGREHVRTYPETAEVADAEKVIGLGHTTLGIARRRWSDTLGEMTDADIGKLCDWTPPRYLALLPPALRARWKLANGDPMDAKGSSNDERTMFYYVVHVRSCPDYPKGATVYVNGSNGGFILGKDVLAAELQMPKGGTSVRCMDIPLVQIDLIGDAEDKDPAGKPLIERFGAASDMQTQLASDFQEAVDVILHPARYTTSTSPVSAEDVEESRATGKHIAVLTNQDYPKYEEVRALPPAFFEILDWNDNRIDSISGLSKPAQGSNDQQEVSGVARQIAVNQAQKSLSRASTRVNGAWERHFRIKLQLAMKEFSAPTLLRYVGEDGAYKQEWFTGVDFALVTDVGIQPGTGTMLPPQEKVNYLGTLKQLGFMDPDEASDAARPAFTKSLGIAADPHQQRIERQVGAWLKGPPAPPPAQPGQPQQPSWIQQRQQYEQEMQQYQQLQAASQQATAAHQNADQNAKLSLHPTPAPAPPQLPPPPQAPWTPFAILPCDSEPMVAAKRMRRLSRLQASVRFSAQPPEWQSVVFDAYQQAMQVVQASQPVQPLPKGVTLAMTGDQNTVAAEEQAATHPPQPQQPRAA